MSAIRQATSEDKALAQGILDRVGADLGMIIDRSVRVDECRVERLDERVAGEGSIHISFRIGVCFDGTSRQGCLLMPLAEAISMAGYLMMMSDQDVAEYRGRDTLETSMKEAILEVGNFISGACDTVLRRSHPGGASIRSEGCQGVRADMPPALEFEPGDEFVIARTRAGIDTFPEFELILILPGLS